MVSLSPGFSCSSRRIAVGRLCFYLSHDVCKFVYNEATLGSVFSTLIIILSEFWYIRCTHFGTLDVR